MSYTYLLGEKSVDFSQYLNGASAGDNENEYIGFNQDIARWTGDPLKSNPTHPYLPPEQDRPGYIAANSFWFRAHASGVNMAFCDGSAQSIPYAIDPLVHRELGNRMDGEPTQLRRWTRSGRAILLFAVNRPQGPQRRRHVLLGEDAA